MEENILKAIEKEITKGNDQFFDYAWRQKLNILGDFLKEETKYSQLVAWINQEIEKTNQTKNVFSPASKDKDTTLAMVNAYLNLMQKLAVLIHCREMLLDSRTTTQERENIEYTLCKLYKIHYSEKLRSYI